MDLIEAAQTTPARRHPWEASRASFFLRVLADGGVLSHGLSVLDVGAGDAWFASRLVEEEPGATVVCWDAAYDTSRAALPASPSLRFVSSPPSDTRFGLALLLDVLEHVDEDGAFLRGIVDERLLPGASVLVSVPAWPGLFGEHDRLLRHERRYSPASARALLRAAGLHVVRAGGLFHSLLVPRTLAVLRERIAPRSAPPAHAGEWRHGPGATAIASLLLAADNSLSRVSSAAGVELPGLSWWALCRKP